MTHFACAWTTCHSVGVLGWALSCLKHLAQQLPIADQCRFGGRVEAGDIPVLLSYVTVDPVYDDEVAQARWSLKIVESLAVGVSVVTAGTGDGRDTW
jgi:glycosyltransferase involved in cell wall biosynthesis